MGQKAKSGDFASHELAAAPIAERSITGAVGA